jgi:sulfur carrier protein
MTYIINGEKQTYEAPMTLEALIKRLGVARHVMAIAVNMEIIKKEQWSRYIPSDGDRIEMLHFVGGG